MEQINLDTAYINGFTASNKDAERAFERIVKYTASLLGEIDRLKLVIEELENKDAL